MRRRLSITTLPALVLLAAGPTAQDPAPTEPKPQVTWPELSAADMERAKVLVRRLDDEDQAAVDAAAADLAGLGAAVGPYLLARLADRRPTAPARLRAILHDVVEPAYAPLVAEKAASKAPLVREWVVEFLALRHDPRWRAPLAKAAKDKSPDIVLRAQLGLAGLKDTDALAAVFERFAEEDWREHAEFVARCLEPARSPEMAQWLVDHMPPDDEHARIVGLRLMRSLAPKEYAGVIATFLDAEQHAVKKEAINALRAVVDGDEPLENLSVFQAIDQAKKWRERVR